MQMEGDLAQNWKKFKQSYLIYSQAMGVANKTEEVKAAVLFTLCWRTSG